jgi:hypothetical protein
MHRSNRIAPRRFAHSWVVTLVAVLAFAGTAEARPRPAGKPLGSSFQSNKTFGLGLELGNIEGITGKLFLAEGSANAIDFGLGYLYGWANHGLNLYADYLWHPFVIASLPQFDDNNNGIDAFGVRVPLGISLDLNNVPIDIFFQVVPTLDFFSHYDRDLRLDIDISIGARFYFF